MNGILIFSQEKQTLSNDRCIEFCKANLVVDDGRASLLHGATYHKGCCDFQRDCEWKFSFVIPVNVCCEGQATEPLLLLCLVLDNPRFHLEVNF